MQATEAVALVNILVYRLSKLGFKTNDTVLAQFQEFYSLASSFSYDQVSYNTSVKLKQLSSFHNSN